MIRFLFYLIVFVVSLAAALLWFGEMRHLRMAFPDQLPAWTNPIPDDAGLASGSAPFPDGLGEAKWQAFAPNLDGLRWHVTGSHATAALQTEIVVPWWPTEVRIASGRGTIFADKFSTAATAKPVRVQDIKARVPTSRSGEPGQVSLWFAPDTELPTEFSGATRIDPDTGALILDMPLFPHWTDSGG